MAWHGAPSRTGRYVKRLNIPTTRRQSSIRPISHLDLPPSQPGRFNCRQIFPPTMPDQRCWLPEHDLQTAAAMTMPADFSMLKIFDYGYIMPGGQHKYLPVRRVNGPPCRLRSMPTSCGSAQGAQFSDYEARKRHPRVAWNQCIAPTMSIRHLVFPLSSPYHFQNSLTDLFYFRSFCGSGVVASPRFRPL